jgi:predicted enzyme related to lactoylglutathione lyase
MPHPVIHWQIITPEAEKLTAFYRELFSWRVSQANALGYRAITTRSDRGIDGGVWPAPPGKPSFVQLHVAVDDIDATLARATGLGATVVMPKSVLPDGDAMAVLLDPCGIAFVVCQLQSSRP